MFVPEPPPVYGDRPVAIEIPVFVGGYGISFFEETARLFEEKRPDVTVDLYGDPRIAEKVRIRVIEGSYPDATDAELLWPNLIAAGKVLDLSPWLDGPNWEGDARWRDTFLPGTLDRWRHDDRVYGIPFAHALRNIFYNKTLFREHGWEIPETWDDLYALCEEIMDAGIAPFSFPGQVMRYGDMFFQAAHYNLTGPEKMRRYFELEPGTRDHPAFIRAAEVLQTLATRYFIRGWEGMSHTGAQMRFFEGDAAMTVSGSWIVSEMKGRVDENFDLGAFNFPVFADGVVSPDTLQTGSGFYFVFAEGENTETAVDFFRFLTSRERAYAFPVSPRPCPAFSQGCA